jgi:hypothetical protein
MGLIRFLWRHPVGAIVAVLGAAMTTGGLVSDAYSFFHLGLPPMVWAAIGAALFMSAVVGMLYRWESRLPISVEGDDGERQAEAILDRLDEVYDAQPAIYEGAHEKLMLFVVNSLFPACDARRELTYSVIRGLCENGPIAELAGLGARLHPNVQQYNHGLEGLERLSDSPPAFIPFDEMIESVFNVESGYIEYARETNRIAQTGYTPAHIIPLITKTYEDWRVAHNAMVTAYDQIKCDSRMGRLFRPRRESRWGGIQAPFTGAVPLPLLRRELEADRPQ